MKKSIKFLLVGLMFAGFVNGAFGATSANYFVDGKGNPLPYAAMCTVHAYNIGDVVNMGGDRKEEMNKVVALKANLITREMKKQYDYLDATVKRFQIQLQKAVLVAQAEAAGAPSAAGSGGTGSASTLAGTDNCNGKSRTDTVYCLRNNYQKLMAAANAGKSDIAIRNQVAQDINAIVNIGFGATGFTNMCALTGNANIASEKCEADKYKCSARTITTAAKIKDCLYVIGGAINAIEEAGARAASTGASGR